MGIDTGKFRIYTLSGEQITVITEKVEQIEIQLRGTMNWSGKNENGETVTNGIYIYVYESPREKGIGKFTVIRQ